jgi:putative Mn2+ efflux pump MntP
MKTVIIIGIISITLFAICFFIAKKLSEFINRIDKVLEP